MSRSILGYVFLIFIFSIPLSCSKKNMGNDKCVEVNVLFYIDGFSTVGYNDLVLRAIERSAQNYGFEYSFYVPESIEDGMQNYRDWCSTPLEPGVEKSLYIFASGVYEDFLEDEEHPNPDTGKDILLFETEKELPYAYSFAISYYGTTYFCAEVIHRFSGVNFDYKIIAANPYVPGLNYVVDAVQASVDNHDSGTVEVIYLSTEPGSGYNDQELAYLNCLYLRKEDKYLDDIYIPYAGMSNLGVYRFSTLHYGLTLGVDGVGDYFSSNFMPISMTKNIELAFRDFYDMWNIGEDVLRNVLYTLESGKAEAFVSDRVQYSRDIIDDMFNEAIQKEREYFKNR